MIDREQRIANFDEKQRSLYAEGLKILKRIRRRERLNAEDNARGQEIEAAIHKEEIRKLEGVEGAVKVRHRDRGRYAHLNDATGTVLKANRKNAAVKFSTDEREWDWPIDELIPVEWDQGWRLLI